MALKPCESKCNYNQLRRKMWHDISNQQKILQNAIQNLKFLKTWKPCDF